MPVENDEDRVARPRAAVTNLLGALAALYSATFLIGAMLHLGVRVPLGPVMLHEPRIVPATVVEGLCGFVLAIGAYAALGRKRWSWRALTAAHALALGGVLLGMAALALEAGPSTTLNSVYHGTILLALVAGLVALLSPAGKSAFGGGGS